MDPACHLCVPPLRRGPENRCSASGWTCADRLPPVCAATRCRRLSRSTVIVDAPPISWRRTSRTSLYWRLVPPYGGCSSHARGFPPTCRSSRRKRGTSTTRAALRPASSDSTLECVTIGPSSSDAIERRVTHRAGRVPSLRPQSGAGESQPRVRSARGEPLPLSSHARE